LVRILVKRIEIFGEWIEEGGKNCGSKNLLRGSDKCSYQKKINRLLPKQRVWVGSLGKPKQKYTLRIKETLPVSESLGKKTQEKNNGLRNELFGQAKSFRLVAIKTKKFLPTVFG
jgi:hypothetical protein